jgi:hypothetical protein
MQDDNGIIPQAMYEIMTKLSKRALQGQVSDMWSIPSPAYLHHPNFYNKHPVKRTLLKD